jgi:hypothetical protein
MSNMHITTTQRTIAYLLLGSQLLTSCGINNTILPSKDEERTVQQEKNIEKIIIQQEIIKEEQEINQTQIVGIPTELAIDKKTDFFEFQTKDGYQVSIQDGASKAIVKETIGNFSREQVLPVYNPSNRDLREIARQDKLSQQYKVRLRPGHVLIGELGLAGGVKSMRVDVPEVLNGVKGGYAKLNRQAETLTAWMPFINAFTSALSHINFTLQLPSDPSTLNPGNIRDQFVQMTRTIMQRNVQLDNYGLAWYNLISEVRNQINREKHLDLDPAQYPLDSYSITLKPNVDKMIPLIGEMDKLYEAKLNSNVSLDFTKLLGFADVVVNLEGSFYEFEQKKQEELAERRHQEQEREQREKEENLKSEKEEKQKLKKPEDYDLPGGESIPHAIKLDKKIVNLTFGESLIRIWDKQLSKFVIQKPETYVSADRLVDPRLIPAMTQVFNIASKTVDFSTIHISATTNGHDESEVSNHKVENGARAIDISRIDEQFVKN